jgi:hypothetical protein
MPQVAEMFIKGNDFKQRGLAIVVERRGIDKILAMLVFYSSRTLCSNRDMPEGISRPRGVRSPLADFKHKKTRQ